MKRRQLGQRGQHHLRPPAGRDAGETGVDVLRNREKSASGDRSVGCDDGGRWDVMMVGDRLETDIAFANRVGALDSVGCRMD